MDEKAVFLTILGMCAVTYVPRALPLLALASRDMPEPIIRWLSYIPACVLSALLMPSLFIHKGAISFSAENLYLWAAIPAAVLAFTRKSFFGTVALGMALVAAGRYFFIN